MTLVSCEVTPTLERGGGSLHETGIQCALSRGVRSEGLPRRGFPSDGVRAIDTPSNDGSRDDRERRGNTSPGERVKRHHDRKG